MTESFSASQYLRHVRTSWPVLAVACVVAAVLTYLGNQLMTPQYTAEARVRIELPGSDDPHSALVISPVYMDSLKTYALLASGNELFAETVDALGLRDAEHPEPLDGLKQSILEIEIPHHTRVLMIRVTLEDPEMAQALAEGLAAATVRRNQELNAKSDEARTAVARAVRDEAVRLLREREKAIAELSKNAPLTGLPQEFEALVETRAKIRERLLYTEVRRSELSAGNSKRASSAADEPEQPIRITQLREQLAALDDEVRAMRFAIASRASSAAALEAERDAALETLSTAESRLLHETAMESVRGERLQIIDRGVIPGRPSSPRVGLNVLTAVGLALVLALLYVSLRFGLAADQSQD